MAGPERLQKILARAGLCSRRAAEDLLRAGRVTVDGRVAGLGDKADPDEEKVAVDGRPVVLPKRFTYIALNKPAGYLTSRSDPHHGRMVYDLLPTDLQRRVNSVGRLDLDSEGLLLLTDDGELAHRLAHPSYGVRKIYRVVAKAREEGQEAAAAEQIAAGVTLKDGPARPERLRVLHVKPGTLTMEVVLAEGRKREVRRMCAAVGLKVTRLRRIGYGPLKLGRLPRGEHRYLSPAEVDALRRACKLHDQDERQRKRRASGRR